MSVIRVDLAALQRSQQITAEEAARLAALALPDQRGRLAVNLLTIFGAIAVAAAALALLPNPATGLALAILAHAGAGLIRRSFASEGLSVLAAALALMGTLGLAGWVAWKFGDAAGLPVIALAITAVLVAGALLYRSAFLAALGVVSLGAALGSGTAYWHACYAFYVEQPAQTIAVFGTLMAGLYLIRSRIAAGWQALVTVSARTSLFLVHLAFWIGSLWGDRFADDQPPEIIYHENGTVDDAAYQAWEERLFTLPDWAFVAGWAAFAIVLALAARRGGLVSVSAIVFLAINFYTQYFERLGASSETLLVAGLTLVGLAVGLAQFLGWRGRRGRPQADSQPAG